MSKLHIANTFFERELEIQLKMSLREAFLQHAIFLQLQFLPALYADPKDGLILSDLPDPKYWPSLNSYNIFTPPYFTLEDKALYPNEIESWGPSQLIAEWAESRGVTYSIPNWQVIKEVNSKRFSFENNQRLPNAILLTEESQAKHWIHSFQGIKVLKSCFGFSGKGHLLIEDGSPSWDRIAQFLHEEWKKNLPVIAEPWVPRILDFSTQWHIEKNRQITYLGSTICQNNRRGQYQYNEVGDEQGLFQHYFPYLVSHQQKVKSLLTTIANRGFFGNLGIDAMLYTLPENPEDVLLQPVVEINARKTMGWAALIFQKRYFPEKKIRFCYTNSRDGYLPNSLVLKNGKKVSFARNLRIEVYN